MPTTINGVNVNSPASWEDLRFPLTESKVGSNLLPHFDRII